MYTCPLRYGSPCCKSQANDKLGKEVPTKPYYGVSVTKDLRHQFSLRRRNMGLCTTAATMERPTLQRLRTDYQYPEPLQAIDLSPVQSFALGTVTSSFFAL